MVAFSTSLGTVTSEVYNSGAGNGVRFTISRFGSVVETVTYDLGPDAIPTGLTPPDNTFHYAYSGHHIVQEGNDAFALVAIRSFVGASPSPDEMSNIDIVVQHFSGDFVAIGEPAVIPLRGDFYNGTASSGAYANPPDIEALIAADGDTILVMGYDRQWSYDDDLMPLTVVRIDGQTGEVLYSVTGPSHASPSEVQIISTASGEVLEVTADTFTNSGDDPYLPGGLTTHLTVDLETGAVIASDLDSDKYPGVDPISMFDDFFRGTTGADVVHGLSGNDSITTGDGDDRVFGGRGHDNIATGNGNDIIRAGLGNDTVGAGSGDDEIDLDDGNDVGFAGPGNDSLFGDDGNDDLSGGYGFDTIDGGAGNDTIGAGPDSDLIYGSGGNDIIGGGSGSDTIDGGGGADTIYAGEGHDRVSAGGGNDLVQGGGGDDTITGGDGDDTIVGGYGDDSMAGGAGIDVFVFDGRVAGAADFDVITDFSRFEDRLQLGRVDGATDAEKFAALSITDQSGNTLVTYNDQSILIYGHGGALEQVDFIFI